MPSTNDQSKRSSPSSVCVVVDESGAEVLISSGEDERIGSLSLLDDDDESTDHTLTPLSTNAGFCTPDLCTTINALLGKPTSIGAMFND